MRRTNYLVAWLAIVSGSMPVVSAEKTTVSLRTWVEHDDNVSLVSDEEFAPEPLSSTGAGVMLTVSQLFHRGNGVELRGALNAFHTTQLEDDASDFDVTGVVPRLSLLMRTRFAGKPASFSASLGWRRDWLGGEGFSKFTDLGGTYQVSVTPAWSVGPSYSISARDYDDEGFDPEVTSRNATRHTLGLASQWRLPSRTGIPGRLSISASTQRNAADGRDFEFDGLVYGAQLDLPLSARRSQSPLSDFALQASLSVSDVDYDDFTAAPRRSDRRLTGSLGLRARLRSLGVLDLGWTYLDFDSNRAEFRAQRNLLRAGLTYTF